MAPTVVRWGILATGGIAESFTRDLTVDPITRNNDKIKHEVLAAASSSSQGRAAKFLKDVGAPVTARPYGSYQELVNDPDVDIIYVATPHSHHYQNVMLCLLNGKNVLCEKAFTVNAAQAKRLVQLAREKNLFLMEAVWTRWFPLSIYVREQITSGRIGTVWKTWADNSQVSLPEVEFPDGKHRMVNPDLAGGTLLDLGIYSLTWLFQTLYMTQPPGDRPRPTVLSTMNKTTTGVDDQTTMLLTFPRKGAAPAQGIASTGIRASSDPDHKGTAGPAIRVQGEKGEVQVWPAIYRPTKTRVILRDGTVEDKDFPQPGPGKGSGWYNGFGSNMNPEGEGHGMFWEADEAGLAVVEGRKEGNFLPLDESVLVMEIMDEIRQQNNFKYPDVIESVEYPIHF